MFVFYYCHKRGRETRIAQEGLQSDIEAANEDTLKRYREAQAQAQATGGATAPSEKEATATSEQGATTTSEGGTPATGDNDATTSASTQAPILADDTNAHNAPGEGMTNAATDDGLASVEEQGATDADFASKEAGEKAKSGEELTPVEVGGKSADAVNEKMETETGMPKVGRVATNPGSVL